MDVEDRGDVTRIEVPAEELLLDGGDASPVALVLVAAELAAVAVGEGDVMHVGQQRPELVAYPGMSHTSRSIIAPETRSARAEDPRMKSMRIPRFRSKRCR
mgnify:CR=1 FL=1